MSFFSYFFLFVLEYGNAEDSHLTGLEAFAFDYEVKWPLSLVINGKVC